jgi:prepilin-type N-terminal cleavage/methylation domain-containing protein
MKICDTKHTQKISQCQPRCTGGMSLVEMLITVVIMGIIMAGTSEMVMINNSSSLNMLNKVDSLNAARQLVERIGKDVRMARNVGDIFGQLINSVTGMPYSGAMPPPAGAAVTIGREYFPAELNPNYGGGQTPTNGWPVAPWPSKPYTLSNTTLVVQIPVFDSNGFPTMIAKGVGNPTAFSNLDNVDTLVYQVLPATASDPNYDPNTPTWIIQEAVFRGLLGGTFQNHVMLNPPVTIMSGIVGPINPNTGQPRIFQYLAHSGGDPQDTVAAATLSDITGVVVNLEVRRKQEDVTDPQSLGIKSEVYMRNNTLSTMGGL